METATALALLFLIFSAESLPPIPAEIVRDWRLQDGIATAADFRTAARAIVAELDEKAAPWRDRLRPLDRIGADDRRWADFYLELCTRRRRARLRTLLDRASRIVFTKHYDLGGSHYAYTEGQSDAQAERHFIPGASLCLLEMDGLFGRVETLLDDPAGVIRDPDVSHDGRRVLFAWKKSLDDDDYHLYELELASREVRQLTFGLGFADYEGAYTPDGHIVFNSTRCVQTVDCWWTEVSNLYTCDGDGRSIRRLTFDQVHTNYPTILPDGRVLYTRWDYNDRGQIYPQGLFQMNPDGSGQTEFYGNNSWFPTTILHARGIPGTQKAVAIFTGHHTGQKGWLGTIDPSRGRQENQGAQLIAPIRQTEAVRVDRYGQTGDQFQYPYPLDERESLVAFNPDESDAPFGIYWMDCDGRRELLAADARISCNQPVPLVPRPAPHVRPRAVDYRQEGGTYYVQDVYAGAGLRGVSRGTVKRLRVVALGFRAAGIGQNRSQGEAGAALASTPVSIGNGAWDVKTVLGEATVYEDGSSLFAVPARTPLYFQALDARGHTVQTMRSWSTLQPGESMSCVGCHEAKNSVPRPAGLSMAMRHGVERLRGFYGAPRGFSYAKEIQPILDRQCVRCHCLPASQGSDKDIARSEPAAVAPADLSFSLTGTEIVDPVAKRRWSESYLALTHSRPEQIAGGPPCFTGQPDEWVNWIGVQSGPPMLRPYFAGSAKSKLITLLEEGHKDVTLAREEMDKIACWIDLAVPYCGDYREASAWSAEEEAKFDHYLAKRRRMEAIERGNIEELIGGVLGPVER